MSFLVVKDNFVDGAALRADVLSKPFGTVRNPVDGLDYPGAQVRDPAEFEAALSALLKSPVKVKLNAARLHRKGEGSPHWIHFDNLMADYAAVIYLNPDSDGLSTGTAFWTEKSTGLAELPDAAWLTSHNLTFKQYVQSILPKTNDQSFWTPNAMVFSRFGRMVTYPSKKWHSRYPFEGFGGDVSDGRLVITLFYDLADGSPPSAHNIG